MLSRAVLPLARPNVFASASAVRVSALAAQRPRWYAKAKGKKYDPKPGSTIKQRVPPAQSQGSQESQHAKEQPEFETAAQPEAASSSPEAEINETPSKPLPDLTQGIPSTLAAELEGRHRKTGGLNLTEDPTQSEEYSETDGRGGGDYPKGGYETSLDRRKARMANIMYAVMLATGIAGAGYLGRNWESEEEARLHPQAPSGWGIGLWYARVKARLDGLTSYYKDPTFEKLLPDEDPSQRQPYTLVLSLEDLLVFSKWDREHGWRVAKRPGLDYFLRYLNQYYELVLFTSVPSMMADQVLRKLDPYRIIRWPLFREATRYKDGEYIKDLSYLNRDLSKVILIDTKEEHARLQPENAIILNKWEGNPGDKTLVGLIPFLEYVAGMGVEDVRPLLKSFDSSKGNDIPAKGEKKKPAFTMGSVISALGLKTSDSGAGSTEGKMPWDLLREQGQKNYELIEQQIRENGETWLKEMAEEEEKARQEQMKSMKGSFTGMFGARSEKE
ncbi:hypothetical protein N7470_000916 [Penicillium chermesinum]|nr:hypothetical protein N7470_000916 [Penicillium chermesinum]